tara:strand:- start:3691 stop:4713 length:1023 start_codon:yes stop_codon:yes gene_type:complete
MKKLFIHQPFFRLLSPVFSGVVVYLLILLLNNNVSQLQEEFLGEELYVCIGLSYIVQEVSRVLLLLFKRIPDQGGILLTIVFQIIISLSICITVVITSMIAYYKYVVGFSVSGSELLMFGSIFSVITFIYVVLFISHQYLYKINSERLQQEELRKQYIEDDFAQFKRGINPHLLFESFEALIVLLHQDKEKSEEFIDHLATIYRYILSSKDKQLVAIEEEYEHLLELNKLFNKLPYRTIKIGYSSVSDFLIVPGTLLFLIELIVRNTIMSSSIKLKISIIEIDDSVQICYNHHDKINAQLSITDFEEINRVYKIYSQQEISVTESLEKRVVAFPKLTIKN